MPRGASSRPAPLQQLREEKDRLQEALSALDHKILAAKLDLSHMHRADEKDLWESQLIILQARRCWLMQPIASTPCSCTIH